MSRSWKPERSWLTSPSLLSSMYSPSASVPSGFGKSSLILIRIWRTAVGSRGEGFPTVVGEATFSPLGVGDEDIKSATLESVSPADLPMDAPLRGLAAACCSYFE